MSCKRTLKPPVPEEKIVDEEKTIEQQVINVLKTVYDPEIPVDIYSLGLIYEIDVSITNDVTYRDDINITRMSSRWHTATGNRTKSKK